MSPVLIFNILSCLAVMILSTTISSDISRKKVFPSLFLLHSVGNIIWGFLGADQVPAEEIYVYYGKILNYGLVVLGFYIFGGWKEEEKGRVFHCYYLVSTIFFLGTMTSSIVFGYVAALLVFLILKISTNPAQNSNETSKFNNLSVVISICSFVLYCFIFESNLGTIVFPDFESDQLRFLLFVFSVYFIFPFYPQAIIFDRIITEQRPSLFFFGICGHIGLLSYTFLNFVKKIEKEVLESYIEEIEIVLFINLLYWMIKILRSKSSREKIFYLIVSNTSFSFILFIPPNSNLDISIFSELSYVFIISLIITISLFRSESIKSFLGGKNRLLSYFTRGLIHYFVLCLLHIPFTLGYFGKYNIIFNKFSKDSIFILCIVLFEIINAVGAQLFISQLGDKNTEENRESKFSSGIFFLSIITLALLSIFQWWIGLGYSL